MEALTVVTRAGYDVALKPRPGSKDPDLAAAQFAETLAKLYPDLEPAVLRSLARQHASLIGGFGCREESKKSA